MLQRILPRSPARRILDSRSCPEFAEWRGQTPWRCAAANRVQQWFREEAVHRAATAAEVGEEYLQ